MPYLGYVELNITFPKEFLGTEIEVPTLAMVVPNMLATCKVLIGTNTLDVLYSTIPIATLLTTSLYHMATELC